MLYSSLYIDLSLYAIEQLFSWHSFYSPFIYMCNCLVSQGDYASPPTEDGVSCFIGFFVIPTASIAHLSNQPITTFKVAYAIPSNSIKYVGENFSPKFTRKIQCNGMDLSSNHTFLKESLAIPSVSKKHNETISQR